MKKRNIAKIKFSIFIPKANKNGFEYSRISSDFICKTK
jgi:hypothetical protein